MIIPYPLLNFTNIANYIFTVISNQYVITLTINITTPITSSRPIPLTTTITIIITITITITSHNNMFIISVI